MGEYILPAILPDEQPKIATRWIQHHVAEQEAKRAGMDEQKEKKGHSSYNYERPPTLPPRNDRPIDQESDAHQPAQHRRRRQTTDKACYTSANYEHPAPFQRARKHQ